MIYKCGHCGFVGYCYGVPTSQGVSAPFCYNCQMNDNLEKVEDKTPNKPLHIDRKSGESLK